MDAGLLAKLFGQDQQWQGPCTVVLDAEASIQTVGTDSIQGGGAKVYAPRTISGRIVADSACYMRDGTALVLIQHYKIRQATGEETPKQTLTVVDPKHVVAVEFGENSPMTLQSLGLSLPAIRASGSHPGVASRPRQA
ncbi:MAG: hypothetical protein K2R98_23210 [Gemmataceae bacterium]|nr:hypothetical protein [Gemmataceae bacterium]